MGERLLKVSRLSALPIALAREKIARDDRSRSYGDEEQIMEEPTSVAEYDAVGETIEVAPHLLCSRGISRLVPEGGTLLDLGCGSARLLTRLATGRPDIRIIGLDLSDQMLETGRRNLAESGLDDRVELRKCDITTFDAEISEAPDAISCNYALHHMPTEELTVSCLAAIARMRERTGCALWIFDFARLKHPRTWPAFADILEWPGFVVRADAIASEQSAFTLEEMTAMLERAGLSGLSHLKSRPLGEMQVHWAQARNRPEPVTGLWQDFELPAGTRLIERVIRSGFPRALTRT